MADPITTEVSDPPYVNPQLDANITTPKQKQKLNESFSNFWNEIDTPPTAEAPPKAPVEVKEEPKDEPVVPLEKAEPADPEVKEVKEVEVKKDVEPKPEPKTDIDALEPHPDATEEKKSNFKALKEATKALSAKTKAWETIAPALQELGYQIPDSPEELSRTLGDAVSKIRALKAGGIAPEIETELTSLRTLARSVGVLQSEEFKRDFVTPVEKAYFDVIDEMSKYFEAPPEKIREEFTEPLKTKFRPSQLPPDWWDSQLELIKAPNSIKRKLELKVANVLHLQEKHDIAANELASNQGSYSKWHEDQQKQFQKDYNASIFDETEVAFRTDKSHMAALRPMALDGVTDPVQREAIVKHNAHFTDLQNRFSNVISDFNSGPRKAARLALEHVEMQETLKTLKDEAEERSAELEALKESKESELKTLNAEIEKLRAEVTNKRKIADAPLKATTAPTAKPTEQKKTLPKDARKSLESAFEAWKT